MSYSVARKAGENVGSYTLTASGSATQGDYQVTYKTATFTINRKQVAVPKAKTGLSYTGVQQIGVTAGEGYTLVGGFATNAGTYTATATLDANHAWTGGTTTAKSISWSIAKTSLAQATVSLSATSYTYDGAAKEPTVTVRVGSRRLVAGTDYNVTGASGTNAGTYTVVATSVASGNYTGTATTRPTFTIAKATPTITLGATSYSKTFGNAAFNINAKLTKGTGKLSYKSSSTAVATVSTAGLVTIKGAGTTTITVTVPASTNFVAKSVTTKVTVAKAANPITASARKESISVAFHATNARTTAANVARSNAQGAVTFSNVSTNATAKKFTVNASTGAVTVPKATAGGTYAVIVRATAAGNANYNSGYKNVSYKIVVTKIANTLTVKQTAVNASLATLKSKAVVVSPITVSNAKGTVTYAKASGAAKLTVNKTTGKVTVAKGTAKGTYSAVIKVTAAGNASYNAVTKSITVRVTVK